jgi:hypothetical protein
MATQMFNKPEQPIVVEAPEEVLQVRLQHPSRLATGDHFIEGRQSVMALSPAAGKVKENVGEATGSKEQKQRGLPKKQGHGGASSWHRDTVVKSWT